MVPGLLLLLARDLALHDPPRVLAWRLTHDPRALASALRKIEAYSRGTPPATTNPSTAHLFISNPFKGGAGVANLFSTHPSTAERIERLERMAYDG